MNELSLKSSFEFGTHLMNNLDAINKNEYRCIECNFETLTDSVYQFNYIFNSSTVNKSITFSYIVNDTTQKCKFQVTVESLKGDRVELHKLIKVDNFNTTDIFNCDSYNGQSSDKIKNFVENLNKVLSKQLLNYVS